MNKLNLLKIAVIFGAIIVQTTPSWSMGKRLPANDPGSTPVTQPENPGPVTEVTPLWESQVPEGKNWTTHVSSEIDRLGQNLVDVVPADADLFCPKFSRLSDAQRKQYWIHMISSMVRFESNFKTGTSYKEGFSDSKGKPVISRGLLQISIESANSYGCGFRTADELHDPLKNLSCGVRILDRWVGRDGRIAGKVSGNWRGGARYWSVLRAGDKTSYNSIVRWSQNLAICK
jgi:hypothetical protein